jgi:hypothetical protein
LKTKSKFPEDIIYKIWEDKRFNLPLSTAEGLPIDILDSGVRNNEAAGPDYQHARIKIGNITFTGDVEIDTAHSDWKSHGHNINERYNKVILHVVLSDDSSYPFVITQNGRKVPTLSIEKHLSSSIKKNISKDLVEINQSSQIKMPCSELNDKLPRKDKLQLVKNLGLVRFKNKCENDIERLKEIILLKQLKIKEPKVYHDFHKEVTSRAFSQSEFEQKQIWEKLLYEQIFEALGYSKNKDSMLKLSRYAEIENIYKIENLNSEKIESILFHISGLFPEVTEIADERTSEYVRSCIDIWNNAKMNFDSGIMNKNEWNFFKLRPQNFPTLRIAAGARILKKLVTADLFNNLTTVFEQFSDTNKIINKLRNTIIIKSDGYWANYYTFNKPSKSKLNYFIGVGRADEIVVNIVLPLFSVYFEMMNQAEISKKVLNVFLNYYQKESNHLVDQVNENLGFKNEKFRSVYYQGMIELFRNYCIKDRCLQCEIGKKVFTNYSE